MPISLLGSLSLDSLLLVRLMQQARRRCAAQAPATHPLNLETTAQVRINEFGFVECIGNMFTPGNGCEWRPPSECRALARNPPSSTPWVCSEARMATAEDDCNSFAKFAVADIVARTRSGGWPLPPHWMLPLLTLQTTAA